MSSVTELEICISPRKSQRAAAKPVSSRSSRAAASCIERSPGFAFPSGSSHEYASMV
jgi:hypothetical protein